MEEQINVFGMVVSKDSTYDQTQILRYHTRETGVRQDREMKQLFDRGKERYSATTKNVVRISHQRNRDATRFLGHVLGQQALAASVDRSELLC